MAELLTAVPAIEAPNVPAAVAFWVNTLGFRLVFSVDGFACVARDSVQLYLTERTTASDADITRAWFLVKDIDELHSEWLAKLPASTADGASPALSGLLELPWGRGFAVRDRAGNHFYFADLESS